MGREQSRNDTGVLLAASRNGDASAARSLDGLVYETLRELAASCMRKERRDHTLSATALVHEAYLRLAGGEALDCENERSFYALAARAMRRVLVDHARSQRTAKRGGGWDRITVSEAEALAGVSNVDLIDLNDAMTELESLDEREARVVELRFFAGFTIEETTEALGVSRRTVDIDWRHARAWLMSRLSDAPFAEQDHDGTA